MWIKPVFNAADYAAPAGGQWIVQPQDVITLEYQIVNGDTMHLNWIIGNTQPVGGPVNLRMKIPDGYKALARIEPIYYYEEGASGKRVGWMDINPSQYGGYGQWVSHFKFDLSPWLLESSVHGSATFGVTR